jgi:hypothetical protein
LDFDAGRLPKFPVPSSTPSAASGEPTLVGPIEPKGVLSKWRNDCGVVARKNARSFGPGMMFQKTCKKHYGDSLKNIIFSLLSKNNLAKMV